MSVPMQMGFKRIVKLEWLERAAALAASKTDPSEAEVVLRSVVSPDEEWSPDDKRRTGTAQTVTILLKIWMTVPASIVPFRNDGIELFSQLPASQHLPLHWGMSMAVYPFFGAIAEHTGRLLQLQSNVAVNQVQRRIKELMGERDTVSRATQRVLRSFIDWRVLNDTGKKGVYEATPVFDISERGTAAWLMEALLRSTGSTTLALKAAAAHPSLFPFVLPSIGAKDVESFGRLALFRQGLDEDMVILK